MWDAFLESRWQVLECLVVSGIALGMYPWWEISNSECLYLLLDF